MGRHDVAGSVALGRYPQLIRVATLADVPSLVTVSPRVRAACVADLPRLLDLVREFGASRDFREPFTQDRAVLANLLTTCLQPSRGTVLVLQAGSAVVGLFVCCLIENPISRERIASELVWFVEPGARGGGKALLDAAETWAASRGAVRVSLIAPSERIGRVYARWGYLEGERAYSKSLRPPVRLADRTVDGVTLRPAGADTDWGQCWGWLTEDRAANLDDSGPQTFRAWVDDAATRAQAGRRLWIVAHHGTPCGFVSWVPLTARLGMLQGICFARSVHGTGIASTAVRRMLADAFAEGIEKLSGVYLATNARVGRFLQRLGAIDEGYLSAHTTQDGVPVDLCVVALFAPRGKD